MTNSVLPVNSSTPHSPRLIAKHQSVSEILSILVFIIGVSVLVGWIFDIPSLKSVFPGLVTMKMNAAIGFILLSASLWMTQSKRAGNPATQKIARACSWGAILIGALTLAEYFFGWNLGIDQLIIKEGADAINTPHPGRPSPLLVMNLVFIGMSILLMDARQWRGINPANIFLFPAGLISFLTFFGHIYGVHYLLFSIPGVTAIALHSTIAFILLCFSVLFARPARGAASILVSETMGGVVARRMLFQSIIFLIILDYLINMGLRMGFYDEARETVIHNTFLIAFFTYTILATSRVLEQTDITRKKTEEVLNEKSRLLTNVINSSHDYIFVKDSGLRTVLCNEIFAQAQNKLPADLYGKTDIENGWSAELVKGNPEKGIRGFEQDDLAVLTGKVIHSDSDLGNIKGEIRYFDSLKVPLRDDSGNIIGLIGISRDITDRKRAEAERDRLFKLPLDMACIAGTDGYFKKVNPAFTKILGFSEKEFLETPYNEFIHPDDRQPTQAEVEKQLKGGLTLDFENRYRCKDGSYKWLAWKAVAVLDEGILVATARDMTENKKAKDALIEAKNRAEEATELKDKFVSLVAHDLKSPLTSLIGFLKLVEGENVEPLNEGAKLVLKSAIESGRQMALFIDEVLNISRLRTGQLKLDMQFFDAKYLGEKMVADYSYLAGQKGIGIKNTIPENSRIYGDRILLSEAIQNLITNAVKFCRAGDNITISLAEDDKTAICVADTGPGIEQKLLENLFQYEKKTSTPGTQGELGSGLGLPLAKDIMKLHGGELMVESGIGKGSRFCLKLPYVRPRILIVDDDPQFRFLQIINLRRLEADISEAGDGEEALAALAKELPHLIITDIKMPKMDGLELLKRLKGTAEMKDIPVMVVSGEYGMEIRDTVFKLGGEDFSTKTIDMDDFIPRIRRFIG